MIRRRKNAARGFVFALEIEYHRAITKKGGEVVRFLAQFSASPHSRLTSFWHDAQVTETWLQSLGHQVSERRLHLRARSRRQLLPWLRFQHLPLRLEGWLESMEVPVTVRYLIPFLGRPGMLLISIPCGGESLVEWRPGQVLVRAPRDSWVWDAVEDVWDPASWHSEDEIEWWIDGRPHHAERLSWGTAEHRTLGAGFEEWRLDADDGMWEAVDGRFLDLAQRLGTRPMKVHWSRESMPIREELIGVGVRFTAISMDVIDTGELVDQLQQMPEPLGLKVSQEWTIPHWNQYWETTLWLRRFQGASRLEAFYRPRRPDFSVTASAWRSVRREIRQLPILHVRPLTLDVVGKTTWGALSEEAARYRNLERLEDYLKAVKWPDLEGSWPGSRLRFDAESSWHLVPLESQTGRWVLADNRGLSITVEWPAHSHPVHVSVRIGTTSGVSVLTHTPYSRQIRHWRFWAEVILRAVIPALDGFDLDDEKP